MKYIQQHKSPEILVITPLRPGDKVSVETRKSLKRCDTPFTWVSFMGDNNPAKNTQLAYRKYAKEYELPDYVIKIDNDLELPRRFLDKMISTLKECDDKRVAYTYCSFEFKGHINVKIPVVEFDHEKLLRQNYISSCSLINVNKLNGAGGWVVNDKYFRLLDWCLWLKFLNKGFIGKMTPDCHFIANSTKDSVSSKDVNDYVQKYQLVKKDFVDKIAEKLGG